MSLRREEGGQRSEQKRMCERERGGAEKLIAEAETETKSKRGV